MSQRDRVSDGTEKGSAIVTIGERANATFNVVLTSNVTPLPVGSTQGADIIVSVALPLFSFELIIDSSKFDIL